MSNAAKYTINETISDFYPKTGLFRSMENSMKRNVNIVYTLIHQ